MIDNAAVHRDATCGMHQVQSISLYFPFLNPIENVFDGFKLQLPAQLQEDAGSNFSHIRGGAPHNSLGSEGSSYPG